MRPTPFKATFCNMAFFKKHPSKLCVNKIIHRLSSPFLSFHLNNIILFLFVHVCIKVVLYMEFYLSLFARKAVFGVLNWFDTDLFRCPVTETRKMHAVSYIEIQKLLCQQLTKALISI